MFDLGVPQPTDSSFFIEAPIRGIRNAKGIVKAQERVQFIAQLFEILLRSTSMQNECRYG
jgi:hypothetical protein